LTAALAGSAWAQDDGGEEGTTEGEAEGEGEAMPPPTPEEGPPAADAGMEGKPPMILPQGKLAVHVMLGVDLSTDLVAKPIAIAPDVWYGVMPKLEVGLVHSNMGLSGFWFQGLGGGVCVTGEENGCAKLYNGPIGLLAHYLLVEGGVDLAADAGVVIGSLDPSTLSLKLGVQGRWMSGKMAVYFSPNIEVGITKRDAGNKEGINIPVMLGYMLNDKLHAGVQTGIAGPLDGFGDAYIVPVGVGAHYMLSDAMGVTGSFNFWNLAGKNGGADFRDLTLGFMWHN
jgi:hypothetical protein